MWSAASSFYIHRKLLITKSKLAKVQKEKETFLYFDPRQQTRNKPPADYRFLATWLRGPPSRPARAINSPAPPSSARWVWIGSLRASPRYTPPARPISCCATPTPAKVYDIANNQLTGAASLGSVGLNWQLGGFASDPPTTSMGSSDSTSQLVQAMVDFGGGSGAADASNTVSLGTDTSQQPLLMAPQHA